MRLKQLSTHFTFWNKVWPAHLTGVDDSKEITPQALNEIINRRGKSFTQKLAVPSSLMRGVSEKERIAVILDEFSVHEQVVSSAKRLAMQMADDDYKVMGADNDR